MVSRLFIFPFITKNLTRRRATLGINGPARYLGLKENIRIAWLTICLAKCVKVTAIWGIGKTKTVPLVTPLVFWA